MTIRFSCPACGANLAVPDNMAGRKGKCKKCGAAVAAPQPSPSRTPDEELSQEFRRFASEGLARKALAATPPYLKGIAISVGFIVIVLLAYLLWPRDNRDNWERDNAPKLAALKAKAETSLVKGDYEWSLEMCNRIISLIGTRTLEDPSLQSILDYARTNKEASRKKLASNAAAALEREKAEKVRVGTWPINQGWKVLPEGFIGNNPMLLYEALESNAVSSKGKYETTAEYEARKKASEQRASVMAIGNLSLKTPWAFLDDLNEDYNFIYYDADKCEMTIRKFSPPSILYPGADIVDIGCVMTGDVLLNVVLQMTPREAKSLEKNLQLLYIGVPVLGSADYSPWITRNVLTGAIEEHEKTYKLAILLQVPFSRFSRLLK